MHYRTIILCYTGLFVLFLLYSVFIVGYATHDLKVATVSLVPLGISIFIYVFGFMMLWSAEKFGFMLIFISTVLVIYGSVTLFNW